MTDSLEARNRKIEEEQLEMVPISLQVPTSGEDEETASLTKPLGPHSSSNDAFLPASAKPQDGKMACTT